MTQFFVQLPAGDTMTLNRDLNTTTVAAVKATVDAQLESIWRASGVRILRSDLPFCGIRLMYQNRLLAMDGVLSSCGVGSQSTLYAQWPPKSEKNERRKRYGKGWDNDVELERRTREERELKSANGEGKSQGKKAMREAAKKRNSAGAVEDTTQSARETGRDEHPLRGSPSGDGDEVEMEGDSANADGEGAQGLNEEVVDEEPGERQVEERQQERPRRVVEHDDPFADDDSDKENRPPVFAPVMQTRVNDSPAEERLVFDESNTGTGLDLLEEVLAF